MKAWPTAFVVLLLAAWTYAQSPAATPARVFQDAVTLVDARNDCAGAVPLFERVAASGDRALAARALVYAGSCYERLGNEKARVAYRRVIEHYAEQRGAAAQARARLAALDIARRQPARLTLRPLWRERPRDLDMYGKPTIDGLVFPMSDEQGRLVLMDASFRRQRSPIAIGAAGDGLPPCTVESTVVVSPDASEVAFSCEVGGNGNGEYQFRVVRTDPAAPRQRRLAVGEFKPIEWSQPNRILVTRRQPDGPESLGVLGSEDGSWRVTTLLDAPVDGASMSPDGAWVAFDGPDAAGRHDVFVVAAGGGTPVAVAAGASDDLLPGWSPDGGGVLFVSDRTGSPGLWLQPVTRGRIAGGPQLLSQDLGRVADVWAATRDGTFIYFRQTGLVKVAVVSLDEQGFATGAPSTEGTGQLGGTMMPAWSPDGRRLAYHAMLTGSRLVTLGIRGVETSDERLLRIGLRYPVKPRWSPDGRVVAVKSADLAGRYGLYLVDPETGRTTPLKLMPPQDEGALGGFRWTPDGKLVALVRDTLVRIDVSTGAEETMCKVPDGTYGFDVSPADGTVGFLSNADDPRADLAHRFGGTITVRTPEGTWRELARIPPGDLVRDLEWMPDGRVLLFTKTPAVRLPPGEVQMPSVWRVEVATGATRAIGLAMDRLRDLAVSPDGRRLAFTTGAPLREPWVIENYLPTPKRRTP